MDDDFSLQKIRVRSMKMEFSRIFIFFAKKNENDQKINDGQEASIF